MTGSAFLLLAAVAATPCESLATLKLAEATITSAVVVPEGPPPARGSGGGAARGAQPPAPVGAPPANIPAHCRVQIDRKSTRLNSSHRTISYAVFCLKKKKRKETAERARGR